jgi:PAS domain S-box-containing protein
VCFAGCSNQWCCGGRQREGDQAVNDTQFQLFLEHAPAAVAMFDRDMRYLAASRRWLDDYRLNDAVLSRSHYEVFPEIPDRWREIHRRALGGEVLEAEEDRFERADGVVQWLRWEARPWRTADGEIGGIVIFSEDVTERKRSEEALRQSREDFARAQQVGQIGWWRLDTMKNVLSWSDETYRIFGLPKRSPLTYETFLEAVHPDDREFVDARWKAAIKGEPYDIQHRIVVSGQVKWVREKAFLEYDDKGGLIGGFGVAQDITERKRGEEAVSQQARLIELSFEPIFMWDWDVGIIEWNRGCEQLYGFSRAEARGKVSHQLLGTRFPKSLAEFEEEILAKGEWTGELRHFSRDGDKVIVESRHQLIHWNGRRLVLETNRDITDRKRSEEAMRVSETRFRAIFENAATGIAITDWQGRFLQCNPAYCKLIGYTEEELGQINFSDLIHPDDRAENLAEIRRLRDKELSCFEIENRYVRKDGEAVWVRKFVSLLHDQEDQPPHIMALATDVTERRHMEAALLEADRRKDQFLAMLAHELRNPLASIRNAVSVLQKLNDDDAAAKDRARLLITIVERQVDHLIRLVDDLLDVARIATGKIELRKQLVDLSDIMRQAIETSQPAINAGQHMVTISLADQPLTVDGDPVRLTQVFANLLNNSAKYTPPEGRIEISTKRDGDEAVVSIRDNGIGIRAEMLPRVFDLFYQASRTKAREQGGMGIGLALARSLVEMHGGQVEARSGGPGRGSEFVVRLPLAAAPSQDERIEGEATVASVLASHRVLVVDDDRDVADSLVMLLQLMSADVRVAYNGETALATVAEFKPDLALVDIGMSGMDGYETARRIRLLPEGKDLVLVALSGWGRDDDRRRAMEVGFDHHFVKPMEIDALENLLASAPVGA